mmetsp:Transcript_29863/g.64684  ORF Transcript_29863/g.64684 Transcript_29863/m.64684 type:complete len:329 (+) Transcript_29863:45-1031(+)
MKNVHISDRRPIAFGGALLTLVALSLVISGLNSTSPSPWNGIISIDRVLSALRVHGSGAKSSEPKDMEEDTGEGEGKRTDSGWGGGISLQGAASRRTTGGAVGGHMPRSSRSRPSSGGSGSGSGASSASRVKSESIESTGIRAGKGGSGKGASGKGASGKGGKGASGKGGSGKGGNDQDICVNTEVPPPPGCCDPGRELPIEDCDPVPCSEVVCPHPQFGTIPCSVASCVEQGSGEQSGENCLAVVSECDRDCAPGPAAPNATEYQELCSSKCGDCPVTNCTEFGTGFSQGGACFVAIECDTTGDCAISSAATQEAVTPPRVEKMPVK